MLKSTTQYNTSLRNVCDDYTAYIHPTADTIKAIKNKKTSVAYKHIKNFLQKNNVKNHSMCSRCDGKLCFTCDEYINISIQRT